MTGSADGRRISPEVYSRDYLLSSHLEGFDEFRAGTLSTVKAKQLAMLDLSPAVSLLEIGFGRGEFLRHCAGRCSAVAGIDYSPDAWAIARETLREFPAADIRVADCRELPFADESFDRVFSGDVIEHQNYADGVLMLREAWRVLKPGGFLLVHTSPNTVFMRWVYPPARVVLRLVNAESVAKLDRHIDVAGHVHLHEFNLLSLKRIARDAGLPGARAWIDPDLLRSGKAGHTEALSRNPVIRFAGSLGRFAPVRFLLGNDLYLKCEKPRGQ